MPVLWGLLSPLLALLGYPFLSSYVLALWRASIPAFDLTWGVQLCVKQKRCMRYDPDIAKTGRPQARCSADGAGGIHQQSMDIRVQSKLQ